MYHARADKRKPSGMSRRPVGDRAGLRIPFGAVMRLLVTGAAGMLGHDVVSAAAARGWDAVALARAELDITDSDAVAAAVERARPDAVINCAAWTNVDGAESEAERALAVNGAGAGNVARAATATGAWTVHLSSDYVFDGTKTEPYVESDPTGPVSQYGIGKLAGEHAVASGAPEAHTIVRSSWLFGVHGPCFPKTIMRVAAERDELQVVDDQIGCPTFTGHLAPALLSLAENRINGTVHVAGGGRCSWFDFASLIVREAGLPARVARSKSADLDRPAPRPAYSVLVTERGEDIPRLPAWEEGLSEFMRSRGTQ
jgi:dTDP-4-dehydrorhamnose reductase